MSGSLLLLVTFLCVLLNVNAFISPHRVKSLSLGRSNGLDLEPLDRSANEAVQGQFRSNIREMKPLRDILGLGPAEIAVTLVVGLVLFGPETLKSLSKDVGKAAAELKEIPKTFKEGMEEGAESSQVAKMKAIAAEKKKKRDAKKKKKKEEEEEEEDDDDDEDDNDDDDDDDED